MYFYVIQIILFYRHYKELVSTSPKKEYNIEHFRLFGLKSQHVRTIYMIRRYTQHQK